MGDFNTQPTVPGVFSDLGSRVQTLERVLPSVESAALVVRDEKLNLEDPRVGGSMATALSMLPAPGGGRKTGHIVLSPGKSYDITSLINLDECGGVTIEGMGGNPGYPRLIWKQGAGSGPMMRFNSGFGLTLKGLVLLYDNAAYDDDLITCDHSAAATDVRDFIMEGCYVGGSSATGATSLFKPNKMIRSRIERCKFDSAAIGIARGANYVTTLTIVDNEFTNMGTVAIRDPDNRWTIRDNVFEPLVGGAPGAIDQTLSGGFLGAWVTGLCFEDNYMADASAPGTWVKLRCSGGKISNNFMVLPTSAVGFFLERCFGTSFLAVDINKAGGASSTVGFNFANAGGNIHENVTICGGQNTADTPIQNVGNVFGLELRGVYPETTNPPRGVDVGYTSVASAAALTLPTTIPTGLILVTGTTNITSIAASWEGRLVTLRFNGVLTVTDGSNLILAGNFVTANNATLTLRCDGTNWVEVARSTN